MTTSVSPVTPVPTPVDRVYGRTRLDAIEFGGADPTGKADSTAAIQKCIDALPAKFGGEVFIPVGKYLIDPLVSLQFRDNLWFHFEDGAELVLKPNDAIRYGCLAIKDVENVLVSGKGIITGDRDQHTYTPQKVASQSTHEWGHAIQLYGSKKVTIRDITLRECTGDGISMGGTKQSGICDDIAVLDVVATHNRRQGISIVSARNVVVQGGEISQTDGTLPMCGIDIEPENGADVVNIFIDGVHIHHNKANALLALQRGDVSTAVKDVQVTNCVLEYNAACGIYAAKVQGLVVNGNKIWHNSQSGINTSAATTGINIAENTFGFNYNRGGAGKDRKDFTQVGVTKSVEADMLIRGTDNSGIGKNYFV